MLLHEPAEVNPRLARRLQMVHVYLLLLVASLAALAGGEACGDVYLVGALAGGRCEFARVAVWCGGVWWGEVL